MFQRNSIVISEGPPPPLIDPTTIFHTKYNIVDQVPSVPVPPNLSQEHGQGIPEKCRCLQSMDWLMLLACLVCGAVGLTAVFHVPSAAWLGETQQLIVVGFVLSVSSYCSQGRIQRILSANEAAYGASTIQNFDAISRLDPTGDKVLVITKVVILAVLGWPLLLSILYKNFVGSVSEAEPVTTSVAFGMTQPPNMQVPGYGQALFANTMGDWWSDPRYNQTYGYSLSVESPDRSAILDGPFPDEIKKLRAMIREDQSMLIRANVSAIVAVKTMGWNSREELESLSAKSMEDSFKFSDPKCNRPNQTNSTSAQINALGDYFSLPGISGLTSWRYNSSYGIGLMYGACNTDGPPTLNQSSSFVMTSRIDYTQPALVNETISDADVFVYQAQGFQISIQPYEALWNLSKKDAHLLEARALPPGPIANTSYSMNETEFRLIKHGYMAYELLYLTQMIEFDTAPPFASFRKARDYANTTTDTTFAATMVWSRTLSNFGPRSPDYNATYSGNLEYTLPAEIIIRTETLRRSCWLIPILMASSLVVILTMTLKTTLYNGNPTVHSGAGMVSVMAAVQPKDLTLLRGAAYSGELEQPLVARFRRSTTVDETGFSRGEYIHKERREALTIELQPLHKSDEEQREVKDVKLGKFKLETGVWYY